MKLYDKVKQMLQENPELRDSDDLLLLHYWREMGVIVNGRFIEDAFIRLKAKPESITRARRKVQEDHPSLNAIVEVEEERKVREGHFEMFTFGKVADYGKYAD